MFAVDALPANPPLLKGEVLLLQLVLDDARRLGMTARRIEFALIFERAQRDVTGAISREHWPAAGKEWRYVLFCSRTVPCLPFSLENLGLSRNYGGQTNALLLEPTDEAKVKPFVQGGAFPASLDHLASVDDLLRAIRNHDRVTQARLSEKVGVSEHERRLTDPWLGNALKVLYGHRCQICLHDFVPRYGLPFADTRFLTPLGAGGVPVSRNTVVMCPNHNAIIGAARAEFEPRALAFRFPSGLVEKLTLRDHLLN